ncbi:MAG: APC family permease [Desulfobacterales bacterium]
MTKIGFWSVTSIGVGGMVGGGIFAVLGLAVQMAKGGVPLAFFLSGVIALLTAYAYARLSVTYPSQGGTVEYLNQAFGSGLLTGGLNILLWLSYIVMLSLYAYAFGSYGKTFFPAGVQAVWKHVLISAVVVGLTVLNVVGAKAVGRAEEWIVGIKVTILLLFIAFGLWSVQLQRLMPASWADPVSLFAGGMIIFLAYEGFELIANTAQDVRTPHKTLPRAFYASVGFVIALYVLVSLVTAGNLPVAQIVAAKDYALAAAAKPFLGNLGYTLIAVAALMSTASAINATLYGAARVSYIIAKDGELPDFLEHKIWNRPLEGLLLTSVLTLATANFLDLSSISMMGSAGFLLIFAAVNAANVRLHHKTKSQRWISVAGALACLAALGALVWRIAQNSPQKIWLLVFMLAAAFGLEIIYRSVSGRKIFSHAAGAEAEPDR